MGKTLQVGAETESSALLLIMNRQLLCAGRSLVRIVHTPRLIGH